MITHVSAKPWRMSPSLRFPLLTELPSLVAQKVVKQGEEDGTWMTELMMMSGENKRPARHKREEQSEWDKQEQETKGPSQATLSSWFRRISGWNTFLFLCLLSTVRKLNMSRLSCAQSLNCVLLFTSPWTVACQTHLSKGILQARILKWVTMPSSRVSPQPRDRTQDSHVDPRWNSLPSEPPGKIIGWYN